MALTKLGANVANVQALGDKPTESATQVKVIFDKAGVDIKAFINDTLTVEADLTFATKDEVADIYAGGVADGSVTDAKLSNTAGQIKERVATHLAEDATEEARGHVKVGSENIFINETGFIYGKSIELIQEIEILPDTAEILLENVFTKYKQIIINTFETLTTNTSNRSIRAVIVGATTEMTSYTIGRVLAASATNPTHLTGSIVIGNNYATIKSISNERPDTSSTTNINSLFIRSLELSELPIDLILRPDAYSFNGGKITVLGVR